RSALPTGSTCGFGASDAAPVSVGFLLPGKAGAVQVVAPSFEGFAFAASNHTQLTSSLYYRVVVIRAPLQWLCYTVRDAVDWCEPPTTRWFSKGSNHSSLHFVD